MEFEYYYVHKAMIILNGGTKTIFEKFNALNIPFIILNDNIIIDDTSYCFFKIPNYHYKTYYQTEILRVHLALSFIIPKIK